ncbi:MAG: thiamine pyrophosphate-dependent enzyme [Varibaculum sp.]|nr:thiamine pyrophosphate-dependent enzyme [Varibaculum sp.]
MSEVKSAALPEAQQTSIPAREHVKFYQVGSFAVGNRLADLQWRSLQSDPNRKNSLTSGHRACQGCGEALGARYALDTATAETDGQLVTINATGCLEVFSTPYPETAWTIPWLHSLFGNAAAVASGAAAGLKAMGRQQVRVIAQGGDGGTVDIGMGSISGMFERNDDVLYICYDNEAYMNTGVQRSGATPPAARTATTQPVGEHPGNVFTQGKDMPRIAMAHEIPYVATATVADLRDLEYKVKKAMGYHGARYIHVLVPCPLGWGSNSNYTVSLARLATQTGLFPVYEAEHGEITSVMKIRRPAPVEAYLKPQRRFAHVFKGEDSAEVIARLQAIADRNIRRYGLIEMDSLDEDVRERILAAPDDPEGRFAQKLPGRTRPEAAPDLEELAAAAAGKAQA